MPKNLMESLAEDEAALASNAEPEITTEGDDDGNEPERPERDEPEGGRSSTKETPDGAGKGTGDGGRRGGDGGRVGRPSGKSPQSESGASREDGKTPSRDSGGTRKDATASPEGGIASGSDDGRRSDAVDETAPVPGDHAAWAKLRREKRELEAKLRAAEGKPPVAPATAPQTPAKTDAKPATDAEPDKATNPEAWRDWKDRQRDNEIAELRNFRESQTRQAQETEIFKQAIGEFNQIRDKYISKNPDYIPAFTHSFDAYSKSIKMMRPDLTNQQITQMIDREMLQFAGQCVSKGLNPAEELYDMAIERFGHVPNSAKKGNADGEAEEDAEPETNKAPTGIKTRETPRPNLRAIANNKKRAASPLIGGGQGGKNQLTKEAAANMTMGEMMELDPADWAALESHGG